MPDRTFDIVKLAFRSPLHLSLGKPSLERSEEILHSDTLKSAIAVCAMKVTGMTPGTEQRFDPEFFHSFQVSSSFPYCEGEFFFPRPVSTRVLRGITLEGVRGVAKREKELKKIRYLGRTFLKNSSQDSTSPYPTLTGLQVALWPPIFSTNTASPKK